MERRISIWQLGWLLLVFGVQVQMLRLSDHIQENSPTFLNPPPEYIERFGFGFEEALADSFWLRWIQDSSTCQTYEKEKASVPVHEDKGQYKDPRHKICDNSWSFKMLDAVTKLAPRFKMPYEAGGIYLSVLVEDYKGAKVIFDRGVENYPDDWHILYRAAYYYLFDNQDFKKAAELMERAGKAGAPSWVEFLAARLYSKSGQKELGISTLESFKRTLKDPKEIANVQKRIDDLQKMTE